MGVEFFWRFNQKIMLIHNNFRGLGIAESRLIFQLDKAGSIEGVDNDPLMAALAGAAEGGIDQDFDDSIDQAMDDARAFVESLRTDVIG